MENVTKEITGLTEQEKKSIEELINTWNEKAIIGNVPFDKQFNIEGVPLWWFYRRLIVRHVLPQPLNTYDALYKKKPLTSIERWRYTLTSKILPRYTTYKELHKISWLQKKSTANHKEIQKDNKESKEHSLGKILLLSYSNHLSAEDRLFRLENVIQELRSRGDMQELLLFADPLSSNAYKRLISRNNIYLYITPDLNKEAERKACDLHKKWKKIHNTTKKEIFSLGENCVWPYLRYSFNFFFSKGFIHLTYLYYLTLKKIMQEENVKVAVVTGTGSLFEKCLFAAAKTLEVPIIAITHGIGKETIYPDNISLMKIAVFSDLYKERLVEKGFLKEDIVVVGPVIYDEILPFRKQKKKRGRNVVIATSPYIETGKVSWKEYFKRISLLLDKINQVEGITITIKLHPRETHYKDYVNLVAEKNLSNVSVHQPNISREEFYSLVYNSDCFIHFGSNAALEAMIIDRPIITLNLIGDMYPISHWLHGIDATYATIGVDLQGDVKEALLNAFQDEITLRQNRARIVHWCCGHVDGKSSKRVVDLILNLIPKS